MDYRLLPMEKRHLSALAALERICFSDPWSEDAFLSELDNPGSHFMVAQDAAGTVLGYLGLHHVLDEGYIANIAVDPLFRRQGIGSALLTDAQRFACRTGLAFLTLEVRRSNLGAQALYRRHGFEPVGERKNYYREPVEDAILMTRPIGHEEEPA
ncbi:MAG: ribosomal protein S18-alanine N-acetyltransferase [Oscillospiraceae bacterium]|nr:ribosomal protein S18-alanine N-acetyltransferase [Oscillospiraceae bacterium]